MLRQEWLIKRNCSLSPRQLARAYAVLCAASLAIALFFTWHGAWYVLGFSVLELSAVGYAFIHYARHASDREHIALIDDCLLVELIEADRSRQFRLDPRCTRIDGGARLIALESSGTRVEVGRFLTEWKRREFVRELRQALRQSAWQGSR